MKKGLIIFAMISLVTMQGMAQDGGRRGHRGKDISPEERMEKHIARLDEKLELTDQQEQEIRSILEDSHEEMKGIRENIKESDEVDRTAVKEQMKALKEKTDSDILAVLDDEQDAKYTQMAEKRNQRMKKRMEKRRGHRGGNG
ncbi:Spy/CpxP family protein refolding chaperone [Roseivirga sp. BDSF3-8]|uniref:Spy/CpxP family protein refolding chaperone n=1 Tax=Roseivirga sp. BDSF3-8 TaxID=3241598 RepID=UPI003531EEE2